MGYGVSPPKRQAKLRVFTEALKHLVRWGLTAAAIITNFHH